MAYLEQHVPNIELQQNITNNEPKRILSLEAGIKTMLYKWPKNT